MDSSSLVLIHVFTEDSASAASANLDRLNLFEQVPSSIAVVGGAIGKCMAVNETHAQLLLGCISVHEQVLAIQLETFRAEASKLGVAFQSLAMQTSAGVFQALQGVMEASTSISEKCCQLKSTAACLEGLLQHALTELAMDSKKHERVRLQMKQCNGLTVEFGAIETASANAGQKAPAATASMLSSLPAQVSAASCAAQPWQALSEPPSPLLPSRGLCVALHTLHEYSCQVAQLGQSCSAAHVTMLKCTQGVLKSLHSVYQSLHPSRRWMRRLHCDMAHLAVGTLGALQNTRIAATSSPGIKAALQQVCCSLYDVLLHAAWLFAPAPAVANAPPPAPGPPPSHAGAGSATQAAKLYDSKLSDMVSWPPRNTNVAWHDGPSTGAQHETSEASSSPAPVQWLANMQTMFHVAPHEASSCSSGAALPAAAPVPAWQLGVTLGHLAPIPPAALPAGGQPPVLDCTALRPLVAHCRSLDGPEVSSRVASDALDLSPAWRWLLTHPPPGYSGPSAHQVVATLSKRHELCNWPLPPLTEFQQGERDTLLSALGTAGWAAAAGQY